MKVIKEKNHLHKNYDELYNICLKQQKEIKNSLDFASEVFDYNLEPHDSTILINVLREYDHRLESLEKLIHNYSKYLDSLWLDSQGITTRIKEKWNQMGTMYYD